MIQFNQVTFNFPQKKIFSQFNLTVDQGDFLWVKGHNGCGKTTLLRLMVGLLKPQQGEIRKSSLLTTGWMPATEGSFFARLTGRENLNFFATISGMDNYELPGFLKTDYGNEILQTPFYRMSSGMKQMLLLARSDLNSPQLLILDEPFRSLDTTHRQLLKSFLIEQNKTGKTIVITSHEESLLNHEQIKTLELTDAKVS